MNPTPFPHGDRSGDHDPPPNAPGRPGPAGEGGRSHPYGPPHPTSAGDHVEGGGPDPYRSPHPPTAPVRGNPGTLDLPWYGIGFGAAIARAFRKGFTFAGRAGLGEYWWFQLFSGLVFCCLLGLFVVASITLGEDSWVPAALAFVSFGLWPLVQFVPNLSLTVRRLHDANYSGWFWFFNCIAGVVVAILCLTPSNPLGVRFDLPATRH